MRGGGDRTGWHLWCNTAIKRNGFAAPANPAQCLPSWGGEWGLSWDRGRGPQTSRAWLSAGLAKETVHVGIARTEHTAGVPDLWGHVTPRQGSGPWRPP